MHGLLRWLIGLGVVAFGIMGGMVVGNAVSWVARLATQTPDEGFVADGLLGMIVLLLLALAVALVSAGAWYLGGLVLH